MPRRPTRHRRLLKHQPCTFSPFARSVAFVASHYKAKRHIPSSRFHMNESPASSGNGFVNPAMEEDTSGERPESSDEEEFEVVVQADFAFFDPKPDDFHGVKLLLQTYLDDKEWDLSGFVELILGQTTVGTVVKVENDDEDGVYAVATALNMGRYKDHKCMVGLKDFLLKACQEENMRDKLGSLVGKQASKVGLLVSQQMVNLPPQLLPPLYDALFDEVSWATEDEPAEELRQLFCFKFYLLVTKIYEHKNADQKNGPSSSSDEAIVYAKPEDEIFHKLSLWSFTFPLRNQQLAPHELKQYRLTGLVMAVEASEVSTFREQLKSLINE